ncbi:unnamed protein product [Ixodes persulcatus]
MSQVAWSKRARGPLGLAIIVGIAAVMLVLAGVLSAASERRAQSRTASDVEPGPLQELRGADGASSKRGGRHGDRARLRRSIVQLASMLKCVSGCNPLSYRGYGCFCGYRGDGMPVDPIDSCCLEHDWCYSQSPCSKLSLYLLPYEWHCLTPGMAHCAYPASLSPHAHCGQQLCQCDLEFASCVSRYPCPRRRISCQHRKLSMIHSLFNGQGPSSQPPEAAFGGLQKRRRLKGRRPGHLSRRKPGWRPKRPPWRDDNRTQIYPDSTGDKAPGRQVANAMDLRSSPSWEDGLHSTSNAVSGHHQEMEPWRFKATYGSDELQPTFVSNSLRETSEAPESPLENMIKVSSTFLELQSETTQHEHSPTAQGTEHSSEASREVRGHQHSATNSKATFSQRIAPDEPELRTHPTFVQSMSTITVGMASKIHPASKEVTYKDFVLETAVASISGGHPDKPTEEETGSGVHHTEKRKPFSNLDSGQPQPAPQLQSSITATSWKAPSAVWKVESLNGTPMLPQLLVPLLAHHTQAILPSTQWSTYLESSRNFNAENNLARKRAIRVTRTFG